MCSSNDTVLLSNLSLSRPEDEEGEDKTISLYEPLCGHLVLRTPPLDAIGTSVLRLKGLMNIGDSPLWAI